MTKVEVYKLRDGSLEADPYRAMEKENLLVGIELYALGFTQEEVKTIVQNKDVVIGALGRVLDMREVYAHKVEMFEECGCGDTLSQVEELESLKRACEDGVYNTVRNLSARYLERDLKNPHYLEVLEDSEKLKKVCHLLLSTKV